MIALRRSALRATAPQQPRSRRRLHAARRIAAKLRALDELPAPAPRRQPPAPPPGISLDRVGRALSPRPSKRAAALAVALAAFAHLMFAAWSLAQRPARRAQERIVMATHPPATEIVEEIIEAQPERRAQRSDTHAAALASSTPALPGPLLAAAGVQGSGGVAAGPNGAGGPPGESHAAHSTAVEEAPRLEPPRARVRPAPEYPRRARSQGITGYVSLQLLVGLDGAVRDARVVDAQPPGIFEEAALAAARRFSFDPARQDGKATEAWVKQIIRFTLE
jgi:TonB family protein